MINEFEIKILDGIRDIFSCAPLDFFFKYYTKIGGVAFMVGFAFVLLLFKKTRKTGLNIAIALIIGIIISNLFLKNIFNRARPYDFNKGIKLIVPFEETASFPSGHGMSSFAVAFSLFFYNKKIGIPAFFAAALIAFSRLYLYVHYPTDVLAGILIGSLAAIVGKYITDKTSEKYPKLF